MTTQVPALSATTFGHASRSSVRRIGPSTSAFRAGAGNGGSGGRPRRQGYFGDTDIGHFFSLHTIRRLWPCGDGYFLCTDLMRRFHASWRISGASASNAPAHWAAPCASRAEWRLNRSTRRTAARRRRRLHADRDVAAASGGEAFEQPLQHFRTGRVIIGNIGHQLPGLLPDFERAAGRADFSSIVLRLEQRAQERREIFRGPAAQPSRARSRRNTACRSVCR